MDKDDCQIRTSFNIPDTLNEDLKRCVPWGVKNSIVICLLMKFIEMMAKEGKSGYVSILSGEFDIVIRRRE